MGSNADPGEQVSGRTALATGRSLARQPNASAIVHAGGNSDGQALPESAAVGLGSVEVDPLLAAANRVGEIQVEAGLKIGSLAAAG